MLAITICIIFYSFLYILYQDSFRDSMLKIISFVFFDISLFLLVFFNPFFATPKMIIKDDYFASGKFILENNEYIIPEGKKIRIVVVKEDYPYQLLRDRRKIKIFMEEHEITEIVK